MCACVSAVEHRLIAQLINWATKQQLMPGQGNCTKLFCLR